MVVSFDAQLFKMHHLLPCLIEYHFTLRSQDHTDGCDVFALFKLSSIRLLFLHRFFPNLW